MNAWLVVEALIAVAVAGAWWFKRALGTRFAVVSDSLVAMLLTVYCVQWIAEGASAWTIGLGLLGVGCSVVGLARHTRTARLPS